MADLIRVVERLIAPLRRRVLLMVSRAVVRLVDEGPARQRLQVEGYAGEILDGVERVQEYGFTSCPPPGADAVVLACGGMRQHPIVIAAEDPSARPMLRVPGDVVLYTSLDGARAGAWRRHRVALWTWPGHEAVTMHTRTDAGAAAHVRVKQTPATAVIELVVDASRTSRVVSSAELTSTEITLRCGRSSIVITDAGITLRAPAIRMEQAT